MTWQVSYESKWFSDQQPDLSYFARDEQRTAWGGSCWCSLTIISRRQLDQKIMRVCIFYTHPISIKSLHHTLPSRRCKLCFWANMQVTSTLWPDIKSQKLSEHWFRLRWTKSDARTQFRRAKTGQNQHGPDKEAQDSLLEVDAGGWRHWQADRPTGRSPWPVGPTALAKPRVISWLVL